MKIVKPIIESRLEAPGATDNPRIRSAMSICDYLDSNPRDISLSQHENFYKSLSHLLRNPESERILLYLPFSILHDAPARFREDYMEAWYRLIWSQDVRENFFEGDCLEVDARPKCGLERVVKCVHLLPWLHEAGYVSYDEIVQICECNPDDQVLLQSFSEAISVIEKRNAFNYSEPKLKKLRELTAHIPVRKTVEPLYISQKRSEWLSERKKSPAQLLTPNANLAGPFYANLPELKPRFEEVGNMLSPSEIVLVMGSQLKGYGTVDSDFDVCEFERLCSDVFMHPGSKHAADTYFTSVWIGGDSVVDLRGVAENVCRIYSDSRSREFRSQCIERLESSLLQYRLLHKGYARFYGKVHFDTEVYPEIDGACPFYDDGYRKIATKIFAKYVWI